MSDNFSIIVFLRASSLPGGVPASPIPLHWSFVLSCRTCTLRRQCLNLPSCQSHHSGKCDTVSRGELVVGGNLVGVRRRNGLVHRHFDDLVPWSQAKTVDGVVSPRAE